MNDNNITQLRQVKAPPFTVDEFERIISGFVLGLVEQLGDACPFKNLEMKDFFKFLTQIRIKYASDYSMPIKFEDIDSHQLLDTIFQVAGALSNSEAADHIDNFNFGDYVSGVYNEPSDSVNSFAVDYMSAHQLCVRGKLDHALNYHHEDDTWSITIGNHTTEKGQLCEVLVTAPMMLSHAYGVDTTWSRGKEELHPETRRVIDRSFLSLSDKMLSAQKKHKLDNGCLRVPSNMKVENDGRYFLDVNGCVKALKKHLSKGDVLDSMAYLSILHTLVNGEDKLTELRKAFLEVK